MIRNSVWLDSGEASTVDVIMSGLFPCGLLGRLNLMFRTIGTSGQCSEGACPMKCKYLTIALFIFVAGCVTTPQPQYVDPLASLGTITGNPAFSEHKLGVLLSENVRESMSHLEGARSLISSFGALTNTSALADADPRFIIEGINKILTDRFREVVVVKHAKDAQKLAVDVSMVLDMQIQLGPQSGEQTTVKVSGIFVDSSEAVMAQVDGNGSSIIPWPATSHMFKPAAGAALAQFAKNLDSSTQLETALKTQPPVTQVSAVFTRMSQGFPMAPVDVNFTQSAPRPNDIAVIIGNADYGKLGKDIPDVTPAYADAESFKRYALAGLGLREGNIIDLRDATSAQMERVFGSDRTSSTTGSDRMTPVYGYTTPVTVPLPARTGWPI